MWSGTRFSVAEFWRSGGGVCWASMLLKMKRPFLEVFATDVAASSLTKAKEVSGVFGVELDQFMATDILSSPFPDNYFDIVHGFAVLHHLPNVNKAVKEIHRILKPGGAYYGFGETMMSPLLKFLFTPGGIWKSKGTETLAKIKERVYTMGEWVQPFRTAGFDKFKVTLCKNPRYKYFSRKLLWYYLLIEKVPNFLIPYLLGSEIHIKATK